MNFNENGYENKLRFEYIIISLTIVLASDDIELTNKINDHLLDRKTYNDKIYFLITDMFNIMSK
jgi:hypothetical protein